MLYPWNPNAKIYFIILTVLKALCHIIHFLYLHFSLPDISQLGEISKWIAGGSKIQNCYILNFGWPDEISHPQIKFNFKILKNFKKSASILRKTAPSNCFYVLIGGEYLKRLSDIVQWVEYQTYYIATRPLVYFAEKTNVPPELNIYRKYVSMVGLCVSM